MSSQTYPLTLYYDSHCPLCVAEMEHLRHRDAAGQLRFSDIWAPDFEGPPAGCTQQDLLTLIHARCADGTVVRGVEVFRRAYEAVGLGWVTHATRWPLLGRLADAAYPVLARNRHRIPRPLVQALFAPALRRAAEAAAARRCPADGGCRL